jgi:aldose 1-epimerase
MMSVAEQPSAVDDGAGRLFVLENEDLRVVLTDAGARLLELWVPDRDGDRADVVLGRATLAEAAADPYYMGATAGRYANRVRRGGFALDGETQQLDVNEGRNHLHGGRHGFDVRNWTAEPGEDEVVFRYVSEDGEQGYPGRLTACATYRLDGRALEITLSATTDRPTIVNLVNHSYFNLAGHDSGDVLRQLVRLDAGSYVPVDHELLPTGEILAVAGTPFDFREPKTIGSGLREAEAAAGHEEIAAAGYDHNWVLDGAGLRTVARIEDPDSGRVLELATDQPGLQFYTGGKFADVSAKAAGDAGADTAARADTHAGDGTGTRYQAFAGFTLETQTFPDSPNQPGFPSPVLRPGETYLNRMRLSFTRV